MVNNKNDIPKCFSPNGNMVPSFKLQSYLTAHKGKFLPNRYDIGVGRGLMESIILYLIG